jgi:hypothetical protein
MSESTAAAAYVDVVTNTGKKRRISRDQFDRLCEDLQAEMESGNGLAAAQLGQLFLKDKNYERAEACFTQAAALGDADGYLLLGFMFRELGDKGKERSAYEAALRQGCEQGAFFLGGLPHNTRKDSLEWFELYLELSLARYDIRDPEYLSRVNRIIEIHRMFPSDVARLQKKYLRMPFYQRWAYRLTYECTRWVFLLSGKPMGRTQRTSGSE